MPAQIHTYFGDCVDIEGYGYTPPAEAGDLVYGTGQCQDVQAAVNLAP